MNQLVDAFLDHLIVERGLSANTCDAYRADLSRFTTFLSKRKITHMHAVRREDVTEHLLQERNRGLTPRSLARHLASIRMFFRFLLREKLLSADVTQTIDTPRLWKTLPHSLDYEEVE